MPVRVRVRVPAACVAMLADHIMIFVRAHLYAALSLEAFFKERDASAVPLAVPSRCSKQDLLMPALSLSLAHG